MVTYEELHLQIHRITELSNILSYLLKDRAICDTCSCCEMFYQYMGLVKAHIETVDKEMYGELLRSPDRKINSVAKNFMSGSVEIKKILQSFSKKWCPSKNADSLKIREHDTFLQETSQLFDIVLHRITNETESLYPLVKTLTK